MDEWDDGRIEIELVEHEPTPARSRRAPRVVEPPLAAPPPGDPQPGAPVAASPRNRVVAIAAGVGAAGLLVGWLAGNAGGNGGLATPPVATEATVTTTPGTFADDGALVEPGQPVLSTAPDAERPSTTGRPTTTTTEPEVTVAPLDGVDPRLIGQPYEIVMLDSRGDLHYIDLANGSLTSVEARNQGDTGMLFAGDGWVAIPSGSSSSLSVYHDGVIEPERVRSIEPWAIQHAFGAATMWVPDEALYSGLPGSMEEIDAHGEPTGATVAVPSQPVAIDDGGAFLVDAPGGAYLATSSGTSRLTTGSVQVLGPTAALVYECDEQLACTYAAVDRVTGVRTDLPDLFGGAPLAPFGWWGFGRGSVSPDGRQAMLLVPEVEVVEGQGGLSIDGLRPTLVDLNTGTSTELDLQNEGWNGRVRWTGDSRFAFFMGDREILAYDTQTGEVVRASPQPMSSPVVFDVRPSDGSAWGDVSG